MPTQAQEMPEQAAHVCSPELGVLVVVQDGRRQAVKAAEVCDFALLAFHDIHIHQVLLR